MTGRVRGWLASWSIALAVTAGLFLLTVFVGSCFRKWYAPLFVLLPSALWATWDSGRIRVLRYRTQMANEPAVILFLCGSFWILFFPWYVATRLAIRRGLVPLKEPRP